MDSLEVDQRRIDAVENARDMGMVDEDGNLSEVGKRYVEGCVIAFLQGER